MEREFNACQSHRSMYPSIFNRFPVIQSVSSKFAILAHFLHILASLGYVPGTIALNVTWMKKRIQCWSNASQHVFTSYSEILVWNCNFFLPPCIHRPRWGVPIGIQGKSLVLRKLESCGCQAVKTVWRYSLLDTIPTCDGQTDRRTDVQPIAIACFSMADARKKTPTVSTKYP